MDDFQHLDHHAVLGVPPDATPSDIKQAYRREIAKYHPDRFRHADSATQAYARERSQRITEAYAAINRGPQRRPSMPTRPTASSTADQLAMTYERATALLAAGDGVAAAQLLRQIQKIDPLYRNVQELLERAEAASTGRASRRGLSPLVWLGAGALSLVLIGGGVYASGALRSDPTTAVRADGAVSAVAVAQPPTAGTSSRPVIDAATAVPAASDAAGNAQVAVPTEVLPTSAPPTELSSPTAAPSATVLPTSVPPTAVPPTAVPPTAVPPTAIPPTPAPPAPAGAPATALERGRVLVADDFSDSASGWPTQRAATYTLGYGNGAYAISSQPSTGTIFAFGAPLAQADVLIGADVTPVQGAAGLIFGPNNTYRFLIASNGTYRVEQRGGVLVPATASRAIRAGTNRLAIAAVGQRASLYANGTLLTNLDLSASLDGTTYGFAIVAGPNGGQASFDNLTVRSVPR